ncbi:MAG: alginate export family protein [Planctomycetota bacterium]
MSRSRRWFAAAALAAAVGLAECVTAQGAGGGAPATAEPWRLDRALAAPDWLRLDGEIQLRYEAIDSQFRGDPRLDHSDHLVVHRTALRAEARLEPVSLVAELIDARLYGAGFGSVVNDGASDAVDVLQGYAELRLSDGAAGEHRLRLGRWTVDLGGRRLVGRNIYRNTINAFTGVDWEWRGESTGVRAFWSMPVERLPGDLPSLLDNDVELDRESLERQFMGVFVDHALTERSRLEVYAFALVEGDRLSRRREIVTPGARWRLRPAPGAVDAEVEVAWQLGKSRAAIGGPDLDHLACLHHAAVGYTLDAAWQPRLALAMDYASGDRRPDDGDQNRFDSLFGVPTQDFGPAGIFGAAGRANLLSPELRVGLRPSDAVALHAAWRAIWLADENDAWTTGGVRDATGAAAAHVGQQLDARLRWQAVPQTLTIDVGGAYLSAGGFRERAAPAGRRGDTVYGYLQAVLRF